MPMKLAAHPSLMPPLAAARFHLSPAFDQDFSDVDKKVDDDDPILKWEDRKPSGTNLFEEFFAAEGNSAPAKSKFAPAPFDPLMPYAQPFDVQSEGQSSSSLLDFGKDNFVSSCPIAQDPSSELKKDIVSAPDLNYVNDESVSAKATRVSVSEPSQD
mmetsp:Transcript_29459/g.44652  ORF Transcript_29459/g.44652 Transcript_29459/m.44652 type:complete len:157 (+) Transcript_29459:921-1391(+)